MLKEFGQDLKNLRESKNITVAEISAQTRINPKFINYIESGIFDFQPDTYTRAFLREYARCINESESQILKDYEKAKSGFYMRKGQKKEEQSPISVKPVVNNIENIAEPSGLTAKQVSEEEVPSKSFYNQSMAGDVKNQSRNLSRRKWVQRTFLVLLIIVIIAGVIYMLNYLNEPDYDKPQVKPKSFEEIEGDYKTKLKGKTGKDTTKPEDVSLKTVPTDSLRLTVVTARDVRIKVYIDENNVFEDIVPANDTFSILAKEQFRLSATANASIDLYLNGKYLRKPSSLTGSTIKNLVINKNGIVDE